MTVGQRVYYQSYPGMRPEFGTIVRVTEQFIFVQFESGIKACYRRDLKVFSNED